MEEYSKCLYKDLRIAQSKGICKFSDFLKSLTEEEVSNYYVITKLNEPIDNEDETLLIKKATLLYSLTMYFLEDKGNLTARIDGDGDWLNRIISFLGLDMTQRGGILKDYDGFLKEGDIMSQIPEDFEKIALKYFGQFPE